MNDKNSYSKQRKPFIKIVLSLISFGVLASVLWPLLREPTYHFRPISYYVDAFHKNTKTGGNMNNGQNTLEEKLEPIRRMGPKGTEWLNANLIVKESGLQRSYRNFYNKMPPLICSMLPFPKYMQINGGSLFDTRIFRILSYMNALDDRALCQLLDPEQQNQATRRDVYWRIPPILSGGKDYPCIYEILEKNLTSTNRFDRVMSTFAIIRNNKSRASQLIPILTTELMGTQGEDVLMLLANLGPSATDAIPALEKLLEEDPPRFKQQRVRTTIFKITGRSFLDSPNDYPAGETDQ